MAPLLIVVFEVVIICCMGTLFRADWGCFIVTCHEYAIHTFCRLLLCERTLRRQLLVIEWSDVVIVGVDGSEYVLVKPQIFLNLGLQGGFQVLIPDRTEELLDAMIILELSWFLYDDEVVLRFGVQFQVASRGPWIRPYWSLHPIFDWFPAS